MRNFRIKTVGSELEGLAEKESLTDELMTGIPIRPAHICRTLINRAGQLAVPWLSLGFQSSGFLIIIRHPRPSLAQSAGQSVAATQSAPFRGVHLMLPRILSRVRAHFGNEQSA